MEEGIMRTTPDKEKARSILKMAQTTLDMLKTIDEDRFPSNALKEYYDIIRELISVVLLLDGYKTYGEGAHKRAIEYVGKNYGEFSSHDMSLMDDLRIKRNKITYNGFFVRREYLEMNKRSIQSIISRLTLLISKKMGDKRTV